MDRLYSASILTGKTQEMRAELEEIQQILFDITRLSDHLNGQKHEYVFTDDLF